jgi:hypothetical protein
MSNYFLISDTRPVNVALLVDKVALGQVFLQVLQFSPVSVVPPMLHTHSFTNLSFFFLSPTSFYLTRLGVEGYYSFDFTQWHNTVGRTPLDEGSARRRDLYLTTHSTYNRQTFMPSAGFEPAIPAGQRLQTHALDRSATHPAIADAI